MVARILALSLTAFLLLPAVRAQASGAPETIPDTSSIAEQFLIGVEDTIEVWVYDHPELSRLVTVRPDGRISLPLVQDVKIAGKSPEEVVEILKTRFAAQYKDPLTVNVIVMTIRSLRIYCVGEVKKPGPLDLARPTRILQAVATCGPGDYAKGQITIVREDFGTERRIEVNYKKLLEGDPGQENLYLRPGDTLVFR